MDLTTGPDGLLRCSWAGSAPEYLTYHDEEWGRPLHGDNALFERLTLEGFQSGLSWLTILRKRPAFRQAFGGFDIATVAGFGPAEVARLMQDTGIIRNRAKIEATLHNARLAADLSGGLSAHLWALGVPSGVPGQASPPTPTGGASGPAGRVRPATSAQIPATTVVSVAMSRDLRRRGFRFVGPTTAYALMQATGMVDDHLVGCHVAAATDAATGGRRARTGGGRR